MIAVDSNLLVYAHREDSPWHSAALNCLTGLAEGKVTWAIPWPCLHEFFAIVTHSKVYSPPTPHRVAVEQIEAWMESPWLVLLSESDLYYWKLLRRLLENGDVLGPRVHDARIAALCLLHGIPEIWTADRDFRRFRSLVVRNPLID